MPIFEYKGLDQKGNSTKGVIEADNIRNARLKLKKERLFITHIVDKKKQDTKKTKRSLKTTSQVNIQDISLMVRQLATLIKANIPLVDALNAVSEQVENPALSEALADCKSMVNEGSSLHKALEKYPKIFDTIFNSMVEAGELSGSLDNILLRLADFKEQQAELKSKVSSAMIYPIIMLVVTAGLLSFLFVFLIPKMTTIFESNPQLSLPWYTVIFIDISSFLVNYWYIVLGSILGTSFVFFNWKRTKTGSRQWDAISLKLPIVGPVVRMIAVARFTRTLSTLLTGGVPMINALNIVRNVVGNHVIAVAIDEARSNISEGETIAGPLKKSGQFPPIVIHMVTIGERTGELENMLSKVADAYDFQVKSKLESLTGLITPIVTIIMGFAIAAIVFSVMVPMFEMTNLAG